MLILCVVFLVSFAEGTGRGEEKSEEESSAKAREAKVSDEQGNTRPLIPYIPPRRVRPAPVIRTSGGTRGIGPDLLDVTLLVPDHVGLTLEAQPTLYWEFSQETSARIHVTVIDEESVEPLLAVSAAGSASGGIHALRLADYEVRLEVGKTYEWSIAVVPDPDRRELDKVARAFIARIAADEPLRAALGEADRRTRSRVLAQNGIWYDAFASLSEAIAAEPANRAIRAERASLLEQVGLPDLAERERAAAVAP
jgi:hypothetical protein